MRILSVDSFIDFECIGGACPISCCGGNWGIYIDDKSMEKYMSVEGEFGEVLRNSVTKVNGKNAFKMKEPSKECIFLREDKLCRLYKELGPDALCETCQSYPRAIYRVGDIDFCYLTNSCPEVNRLIMQREDPLSILYDDSDKQTEDSTADELDTAIKVLSAGIHIIQNRELPLEKRLRYLIFFINGFRECLINDKDPSGLISFFSNPGSYTGFNMDTTGGTGDYACKIRAFMIVFRAMLSDAYDHDMWKGCYELAEKIKNNCFDDVERLGSAFGIIETSELQRELEQIMAYRFFTVFMQGYNDSDYMDLLSYECVKYAAICTYAALSEYLNENSCSQENLILFISLAGRIEHANKRKKKFIESIKNEGFNEFENMLRLI